MTALRNLFSFPLLAKELTETAARRRTYVLRVVYGLLLFGAFALMVPPWFWTSYDPLNVMGSGEQMLQNIILLQMIGVGLFLPAMMCGRITEEKERDSLVLLFLTDLRPWSILLQKYVGGLVPMLSFLLLAMPLTATAYAFGGFTLETLLLYLYILLLACLQIGALALFCSAWFRTTVSALIATYVFAVVIYVGPILLGGIAEQFLPLLDIRVYISEKDCLFLFPPKLLWDARNDLDAVIEGSMTIIISIALFLILARAFLVQRAFLPPSSFFLRLFRRLDGVMQRANRSFGNVTLVRSSGDLPDEDPIAWREMSRRALGKVHYLVRILLVIEIPVIFICMMIAVDFGDFRGQVEQISVLAGIVGGLSMLALSVQAANTIVSERVHQTLEVLLTTPLSARSIVAQKAQVLRRFTLVLAIPLLTIFAAECIMENGLSFSYGNRPRDAIGFYIVGCLLSLLVYLPLLSWASLWLGLKMRTRFKAILTALGVTVAWCAVPVLSALCVSELGRGMMMSRTNDMLCGFLLLFSPLAVPAFNEEGDLGGFPLFKAMGMGRVEAASFTLAANFLIYGALLLFFRHLALSRADRYLRR